MSAFFCQADSSLLAMQADLLAAASMGLGMLGISPVTDWGAGRAALIAAAPFSRQAAAGAFRPGDRVTVHFVVRTAEGREIANTYRRGLPYTLVYGDPSAGAFWREALVGLKPGVDSLVTMSSEALFGPQGVPPVVGPGVMLQATIKLVKVQRAPDALTSGEPRREVARGGGRNPAPR